MDKIMKIGIAFIAMLLVGAFGYMGLTDCTFLDGLYMTVITITTVGFGEIMPLGPAGRIFTLILILTGVSFVMYVFGRFTEAVVEGSIRRYYGRVNMEKKISKLRDHYIICGFGRIGKVICRELAINQRQVVVIDHSQEGLDEIREAGYPYIDGDASDDKILIAAGVQRARGLVAVVDTDAANVYIILSARGLNPNLFIMARSSAESNAETKLLRAGANKVISPYFIGASRMAHLLVRPTVIDFIDLAVHEGELGLRLEEVRVGAGSILCNVTLQDSGIRKDFDLIVVAIKRIEGKMLFNPTPQTTILPGDTLILLGEYDHIKSLEKKL